MLVWVYTCQNMSRLNYYDVTRVDIIDRVCSDAHGKNLDRNKTDG